MIYSCSQNKISDTKADILYPYKEVSQVSDTVFFTLIGKIAIDDEIAIIDVRNKRLIVCNNDLSLKKVISRSGRGPGELVYPDNCYIQNNSYYVSDGNEIKIFDTYGQYLKSVKIPAQYPVGKFVVLENGTIYRDVNLGKENSICAVNEQGETLFSFGSEFELEGSRTQKMLGQARHLFNHQDKQILSVGVHYPSFEIYSLEGELLNSQIIDDPNISKDYENGLSKLKSDPLAMAQLFNDVCLFNNSLYLLNSVKENEESKQILSIGEVKRGKLVFNKHYELRLSDNEENAFFDAMFVLNESTIVVYEMNTMAFYYFSF